MTQYRVVMDFNTDRGEPLSPAVMTLSEEGVERFLMALETAHVVFGGDRSNIAHIEVTRLRGTDVEISEDQQVMFR